MCDALCATLIRPVPVRYATILACVHVPFDGLIHAYKYVMPVLTVPYPFVAWGCALVSAVKV